MASIGSFQSRDQNMETISFCPVLHPSMKEFSDFNSYIEKLEKEYSQNYGMVKVVPPKQWKARTADYDSSLDSKMIVGPIEQNPYGKGGVYECIHIMKKSIPFKEYKRKAMDFDKITEGKTAERVEDMFWKNISFSPPLYGSDMQMSLFDEDAKWNLNSLHSILNDGLASKIQGVNTPYLYIGSWKTLFAWHKEDLDLGAINYLHFGKPKFWYCVAREDQEKLEAVAKQHFIESFAKCPQFLRHKTTVINPYQIIKKLKGEIKISKTAQQEGEFVVVFSGAYHHGFNWGYNIAEAVNYASLAWLDLFPKSKPCLCAADNVSIDPTEFMENLMKTRPDLSTSPEVKRFKAWLKEKAQLQQANYITQGIEIEGATDLPKKRGRKSKNKLGNIQSEESDSHNQISDTRESSHESQQAIKSPQKNKIVISKKKYVRKSVTTSKVGRPAKQPLKQSHN